MFDLAFTEIVIIGLVALIVIGPERLPRVARTVGHMLGRLQRYVADVKADINREIELDELRKMRDQLQKAATEFESTVQTELHKTETELQKTGTELNKAFDEVSNPVGQTVGDAEASPASIEAPQSKSG